MKGKVLVGRIIRAHGLRGAVRIKSLSDIPDRLLSIERLHVGRDEGRTRELKIAEAVQKGEIATAIFEGIDSRTEAEALAGQLIFIDEEEMAPPPEGKRFVHELIGMKVVSDDGRHEGILKEVYAMPASPVYAVDVAGREVLIPAVPAFILGMDMETRTIRVRNVPGLFEEEE